MCVATLSHDLSYDVCVCRGDSCTWTVHVHPLCQSYYGCSNGTVTKHSSTGHPSYIATLFIIFKVDVKLCHKARDIPYGGFCSRITNFANDLSPEIHEINFHEIHAH